MTSKQEQAVGSFGNLYLYKRYYYDTETGLYYLNARYYDPALGRFLTKDPLPGLPIERLSSNSHLYVKNNPVNNEDPSGHGDAGVLTGILTGIGTGIGSRVLGIGAALSPVGWLALGIYAGFMVFPAREGTDPKTKTKAPSRPREQTLNPPAVVPQTANPPASASPKSPSKGKAPSKAPSGPSAEELRRIEEIRRVEELRRADIQRYSGSFMMPPPLSALEFAGLLSFPPINIPSFQETVDYSASSMIQRNLYYLSEIAVAKSQVLIPQVTTNQSFFNRTLTDTPTTYAPVYNPALDYLQSGYLWSRKTWDQRVPRDVQNLKNKVNKSTRRFTPNPFKRPPFIPPPNVLKVSEQQQLERHPVGYVILKLLNLLGKVSGYLDDLGGEGW